jgi:MTH538 TIR-like domain (DUF1863).
MARRVFFSFHYENDITRAMIVRNSWVIRGIKEANFEDKAEFEKIKLQGDQAIYKWIDNQLNGTSVTVVLIGEETLSRPFVQYEICESLNRGNGIIGVHINNVLNLSGGLSPKGNQHICIGYYNKERPVYFDEIADNIYDYKYDNGYTFMGNWIEESATKHGK